VPATTERSLKQPDDAWLNRQAPGWLVPGTTLLSAVDAGIVIAQAWLIAVLAVGVFIEQQPPASLMASMWLLLAVLVLRALSGGVRQLLAGRASARVRRDVRSRLLGRFETAGPARLPPDGEVIAAFDEQVEAFDAFYSRFLPQRISATVVPPVILLFAFVTDWLAGLLLLLTAPLIPLFMILIGIGAEKLALEQFRSMARLGGWFLDQVQGAATIRLFRAEDRARRQVEQRTHALRRETMRVLRLAFLSSAVLEFFSAVAIASLAIYIGLGLLGYLTFGQCTVELRGLSFAHPDREVLLHELELEIEAGQKIVLVGPSGSGKSSLISLLAGFAEPSSGQILLDGQPLARFCDAALRDHVAWLGQRPVLFAGTIAENIALGWDSATRAQIERIADQSGVNEFAARLPDGLDSPVGENGYGLSGGQAQRVALARALIRPRPLVLLDEPTASLDGESESRVLQALESLLADRSATVICAAHRAATMAWADRILSIDQGRLKWLR